MDTMSEDSRWRNIVCLSSVGGEGARHVVRGGRMSRGGHQEGPPSAWLRPGDSCAGQWEAIERAVPRSSVFYIHTTLDSPPVT